ncbi:thiol:disulfide interchange protein DsbG [Acinetobacter indicus]
MKMIYPAALFLLLLNTTAFAQTDLKKQIEQEGFKFIKQIEAPEQMTGWAGHMQQSPATVFISNDQKYYIIGDLHNAKGENLTIKALETHVKDAVLDDVWKSLENSTWIQDGQKDAPRIVYVFSDPNCPYCHTFWQKARPWVKAGKVQLRHIQVAVIRDESSGQVATMLMAKNPQQVFTSYNANKGQNKLKITKNIPADIAAKIDANQELMAKYGFFATPSMVWKNQQGEFKSAQGMTEDLREIFEK